jgi:hypothetical protein
MKKIIILMCWLFLSSQLSAQHSTLLYYLPTLSVGQVSSFRGYQKFIGDPEVFFTSPDAINLLIQENPGIELFCYINPTEWFNPMFPDKPWSLKIVDFLNKVPQWWLKGTDGKRISFWPGMQTMNCSSLCPRVSINGRDITYIEFISQVFIESILKQHKFVGIIDDNLWIKIYWMGHYQHNQRGVSLRDDGLKTDSAAADQAWKRGREYFDQQIRNFAGPDFIILGNPANLSFMQECDGKMFENFPDIYVNESDTVYQAWYDNLNMAKTMKIAIFNARADNYWFTLCSSMLLDNVSFSYMQNSPYDKKWELNLGQPNSTAFTVGAEYCRKFQNGTVYLNPLTRSARIIYQDGTVRDK